MAKEAKKGFRSKWKAFWKMPGIRITTKVISAVFKCLLTIILIGVITASMVGCVLVVYVVTNFDGTSDIPDLNTITENQTSFIHTIDSDTGEEVVTRIEGAKKIWKDLDEIPLNLQNAVIAIEDERFREHYGVDWKRTISAFANLVLHFSSQEYGGSTITQQLVKVVTTDDEHSIERKITEIFRAIEMEKKAYTKDQILEAYLNMLPLGAVDGVGAGANYFFGKDVEELTLAECAYMASITKGPTLYSPYLHPENARRRQQTVLYKMLELGFITEDEYKQAANEEVVFKSSFRYEAVQDYYVDMLIEDVIQDLMDKYGYTYSFAENMIYYGGLHIYSAEDTKKQAQVEAIFADDSNFPKKIESDKEDPQATIFILDYDGRVIATAGGRGKKTQNRIQNRATMSKRQVGSAMKPLSAYGPAIEMNLVHYSTMMVDDPILTLPNGNGWPSNYKNIKYGTLPLVHDLKFSVNRPAAKLVQMLTVQKSFDFVTNNLHLTTLIKSEKRNGQVFTDMDYSPLALGGMTDGVYCAEIAAAYQIFGNGGYYNEPYTYYKVTKAEKSKDEVTLLEHNFVPERVMAEDSAYVMNRMLQQVIFGSGNPTGRHITKDWTEWGNIYGKTGTTGTSDSTGDAYFAGGTPYYVGACWLGYDWNKELNANQTNYAQLLWSKCMKAIHQGLAVKDYEHKGDTEEHYFCLTSGMLATDSCPKKELGVYKKSNIPGYCTTHAPEPEPDPEPDTSSSADEPDSPDTPDTPDTPGGDPATP